MMKVRTNENSPLYLLLIAAAITLLLPLAGQLQAPAFSRRTTFHTFAPYPYNLASLDVGSFTPVSGASNYMPNPPDCRHLGLRQCRWQVTEKPSEGEGHVVDVRLMNGGRVVGEIQLMEIQVTYAEELAAASSHTDTVWIAFVRVAPYARANGIGRAMWKAGDAAIRLVTALDGTGRAYRAIYDLAGWGEALLREIPPDAPIYVSRDMNVII